jgi:hypothetical protein
MDSIHSQVLLMQAEENRLLGQRTFFKKIENKWVIIFIISFPVIAFVILLWSDGTSVFRHKKLHFAEVMQFTCLVYVAFILS